MYSFGKLSITTVATYKRKITYMVLTIFVLLLAINNVNMKKTLAILGFLDRMAKSQASLHPLPPSHPHTEPALRIYELFIGLLDIKQRLFLFPLPYPSLTPRHPHG
jgi:hypothetical protein